jgi:hypothetical protein
MSIIDQVRDVAKLAQEVGRMDLYKMVVELQSQVTELATEKFEAAQALVESRQRIADLEEKLRLKGQLEFRRGVYYLKREDRSEDGPFCGRCWEADQLLIHVDGNNQHYHCRQCENGRRPLPAPRSRKPVGW